MNLRGLQSGFTAGEISPKLLGQVDLSQYQFGCETLLNHVVWPQGMTSRRPGLRFIEAGKTQNLAIRLIPFEFSTEQAYVIEAGHEYFRFYMDQGQILSGGLPYELAHTYQSTDLFDIRYAQSADIMYLAHPDYRPKMLSRTGHTAWTIKDVVFVNGPYLSQNDTATTIAPSATTGAILLTASLNLGAEEAANGTFEITLGAELIVDGDFAVAGAWVYGVNWSHDAVNLEADHAAIAADDLEYALAPTIGLTYKLVYTVKNCTAGTLTPSIGGAAGAVVSADGTYTDYIIAATAGNLIFAADAAFDGSVDDVSVVVTTLATQWTFGTGWTHNPVTLKADHTPGSTGNLSQSILPEVGKNYTIVFTVSNWTAGTVTVQFGNTLGTPRGSNDTFTENLTAVDIGNLNFLPSTDFDGSVDTVSVKEAAAATGPFLPGHVGSLWAILHGTTWGYAKITGYVSDTVVNAEVKETFGAITGSADWKEGAWSDVRGYPSVVGFYENRLFWAASPHQPQTLWGSKTGDYYNFTPGADDDSPIVITLNADYVNAIKWMSGAKALLIGASRGQWHISATGANEALTPSNIKAAQETGLTSSSIHARCDHTILFWQAFGRNLMEVAYSLESDSYVATPLTIMAEHIGYSPIIEMVYMQEPLGTLWCIREDGEMAVLTYERQHKVVAWTRFTTEGYFESIAKIPGNGRDEVWALVRRTVGGATVRYIEMLENLETYEQETESMFYVDSGLTYDGVPVTSVSGLDHLEGKTVSILADGAVQENRTVTAGAITLDHASSVVHVGLPYTSVISPVRLEIKMPGGTIQGKRQRVTTLGMRMYKSYGGMIGERLDKLEVLPFKHMSPVMGAPLDMFTGDYRVQFPGSYARDGRIYIVQTLPLPQNIMALMPRIDVQ